MPIPIGWMISDNTTAETYEKFLACLSAAREGLSRFYPTVVLGDFDSALQSAVGTVWSTSQYCGDYFHFLQANTRWFKRNSVDRSNLPLLTKMLQILWHSPTTVDFVRNKDQFLRYWTLSNSFYARYFHSTWIKKFIPATWLKSSRGPNPSGDQILEAYNNRLKRSGTLLYLWFRF